MTVTSIEEQAKQIPRHFPVAVIMQRRRSRVSSWTDFVWEAVGVTVMRGRVSSPGPEPILEGGETRQYLYPGFEVSLYADECESYYHNLMSPTPRCYVVAREEGGSPVPFLVSLSFDEAHAYLEGDESVYDVDMPPELYRWTESYVLTHYAPEKRKKRKRQDWKNPGAEPVSR